MVTKSACALVVLLYICGGKLTTTTPIAERTTLELVQVIFRHGDRSPITPFPTDPHKDFWTDGLGQLSNIGKQQQYELGLFIRNRYKEYLNDTYNLRDVQMNSTAMDRTIMSAQCQLSGLYAPSGEQVWNQDIKWQPIPVFTVPFNLDYLCGGGGYCPKYDKLINEVQQSPEMQQLNAENKDLLAQISENTGIKMNGTWDLGSIYDTLFCEKSHNLTWPSWVEPLWPKMVDLIFSKRNSFTCGSLEQLRLKGGPILGHMIDNMQLAIDGDAGRRKAYLVSSHDSAVSAFLCALKVYNNIPPPYASAVFLELHKTSNGHAVQIAYKNTTSNEDPHILTLPGCTELCPFDQFLSLTASVIPDDILKECEVAPEQLGILLNYKRRSAPTS